MSNLSLEQIAHDIALSCLAVAEQRGGEGAAEVYMKAYLQALETLKRNTEFVKKI